ncbi:hypothetical protein HPB47_027793 [Ixodes persulcatus]|uniref:Uncharacterized protein n=1 Tax=Ixodes persulcatus TaxID=34615 RepID=A0AC60PWN4_IXOPE|nr:hypothetical protein HPB47_027793 [Ixodes persulcatus]
MLSGSVPGLKISYDSTASYPGPALTEPTPGPSRYKFRDFPVNICEEIAGTKEGQVSGTLRAKIVKQIVSALCVNTIKHLRLREASYLALCCDSLLANGALILLPCLLKEKSNNLVKSLSICLHSDNQSSKMKLPIKLITATLYVKILLLLKSPAETWLTWRFWFLHRRLETPSLAAGPSHKSPRKSRSIDKKKMNALRAKMRQLQERNKRLQ